MNREQFLEYFRSEQFDDEIDTNERIEIFKQCLLGASDITKELLEELFDEYGVDDLKVTKIKHSKGKK